MKRLILLLGICLPLWVWAQNPKSDDPAVYRPFSHIDFGFTVGSTGFGFDLASPMGRHLDLRLGFTFIPPITFYHAYDMLWAGRETAPSQAESDRMDQMCSYLSDLTHTKVDRFVSVDHKMFMYNAKILLDWYPFSQRNFHFSVGAFIGSSRVGYATTMPSEGATMVGINMYNALYDQCMTLDDYEYPTITIGDYSLELDPTTGEAVKEKFRQLGPMQLKMGVFPDGTPHYVRPNDEGVLRVEVRTHVVKPYVGLGYNAYVGSSQRWNIGFDAGILVLGVSPHIYGEDGVCLTHDVVNITGDAGRYIRLVSSFPVYPVLEFKTAYRLL